MNAVRLLFLSVLIGTVPLLIHAAAVSSGETAVLRRHLATQEQGRDPIVVAAMSSIGIREPGRDDWKIRLRRSAATQGKDIQEAADDFIARNEADSVFDLSSFPESRFTVVSESLLREIFADLSEGWTVFRRRFGSSNLHSFSRVGFSRDGRTALYFAHVQRDWSNGEGRFYVVRRTGEVWAADESVQIGWIVHS